jgi:hypothetical protein
VQAEGTARTVSTCCIFSGIDIASVPVQEGGRAGRGQLPLLWDHSGNLQHAVDGARYGPGTIRSGEARFRSSPYDVRH